VTLFLDEKTSKENDSFRSSEWGSEAAAAMCEDVKDFPVFSGGDKIRTLQDLFDRTPKELISKVMLEEKVFDTWYNGRTVLIGDGMLLGNCRCEQSDTIWYLFQCVDQSHIFS
jgi:hypothetical protein